MFMPDSYIALSQFDVEGDFLVVMRVVATGRLYFQGVETDQTGLIVLPALEEMDKDSVEFLANMVFLCSSDLPGREFFISNRHEGFCIQQREDYPMWVNCWVVASAERDESSLLVSVGELVPMSVAALGKNRSATHPLPRG